MGRLHSFTRGEKTPHRRTPNKTRANVTLKTNKNTAAHKQKIHQSPHPLVTPLWRILPRVPPCSHLAALADEPGAPARPRPRRSQGFLQGGDAGLGGGNTTGADADAFRRRPSPRRRRPEAPPGLGGLAEEQLVRYRTGAGLAAATAAAAAAAAT